MNKQKSQLGSAHVVITIILVIALLSTLGFIYWQNFIQEKTVINKTTNTPTTNSTNSSSSTEMLSIGKNLNEQFVLSYPKTWTVKNNNPDSTTSFGDSTIENIRIYSPSKNVYVEYISQFDGSSGYACTNDVENQNYASFTPTRLVDYPELSYYEATINYRDHGYFYTAYLSEDSALTQAPNANFCDLYVWNITKRKSIPNDGDQLPKVAWRAKIGSTVYMNGSDETKSYAPNISELNSFLDSDDFKAAKAILLSAEKTE